MISFLGYAMANRPGSLENVKIVGDTMNIEI
jgi:hypothetical protein